MKFECIWPLLPGPKGWLRKEEARELFRLARDIKVEGVIVEIGTWTGRSTVTLALGSFEGDLKPVHAIDPHRDTYAHRKHNTRETLTAFRQNLDRFGVASYVVPHVAEATETVKTWKSKISLLYIDGHHDYPLIDYLLWEPYLVKGGTIAIHDSDHIAPRKVINHFLKDSPKWVKVRRKVYTVFAEKAWDPNPRDPLCPWDLLFVNVNKWLNLISSNETLKQSWWRHLPYLYPKDLSKAEFLDSILDHFDPYKEPKWFNWEPIVAGIPAKQAGNYRM